MALLTTTALCLRKLDFSETSQILTLLADGAGVVGAIAKGAKREKSSLGGPLDIMCLYQVVLYDRSRRGVLSILGKAELLDFFPGARRDSERFHAVETLRELLLSIEVPAPESRAALLLAVRALRELSADSLPYAALARFAWGLLRAMGVEPVLHACVMSGAAPSGKVNVPFALDEHGLVAPPHDRGRADIVRLRPATLRVLLRLAEGDDVGRAPVDAMLGAFRLLAWLVARQGGRRLRTVGEPEPSMLL
jgi:DNA repair protein RecO (recombination protein O)